MYTSWCCYILLLNFEKGYFYIIYMIGNVVIFAEHILSVLRRDLCKISVFMYDAFM